MGSLLVEFIEDSRLKNERNGSGLVVAFDDCLFHDTEPLAVVVVEVHDLKFWHGDHVALRWRTRQRVDDSADRGPYMCFAPV